MGLNIYHKFNLDWSLTVNVEKTKVIIFSKKGDVGGDVKVCYNNVQLEVVDMFTYLGVKL